MNDTRNKIIELIEPYMDKTQVEWLLIKTQIGWNYFLVNDRNNIPAWDVIGHYDITAVLKYIQTIKSEDRHVSYIYESHNFSEIISIRKLNVFNKSNRLIGSILNKPLHLYSEKEEKDLLELLLKLR